MVSGIVTEARLEQLLKAKELICFTLSGIVTDLRPVQSLNAFLYMASTLSGIVREVICKGKKNL